MASTVGTFMKCGIWDFLKNVEKIQVLLKSDKNNGYFTWRPMYIYDIILLSKFLRMKNFCD
jgi:hypothetical protein